MVELTVLSAVMVLFKAVFAGEDLDRKVGADVISTMLGGLLRTTSPTDPVLLKVYEIVKDLDTKEYHRAMAAGHRYLAEAQLSAEIRTERLKLARERLVAAASAAEIMQVPLLLANAEFAIAQCDVLLSAPEHAAMALDRAAATLEQAIEQLDIAGAGYRWRMLCEAKSGQDGSVSTWLTRVADRDLIRQRDIDALAKVADDMQTELRSLTTLYSQVQTAILAAAGHGRPVSWTQPEGQNVRTGLDAKAVTTLTGHSVIRGFGLTLHVEQQPLGRGSAEGTVEVLLNLTAHDDRLLHCRGLATPAAPTTNLLPRLRGLTGLHAPVNPAGTATFTLPKGSHQRTITLPVQSSVVNAVKIRIARPAGQGRQVDTGGCVYIPAPAASVATRA
jgi:hypothetical protein